VGNKRRIRGGGIKMKCLNFLGGGGGENKKGDKV
jgi:hypothetical protein